MRPEQAADYAGPRDRPAFINRPDHLVAEDPVREPPVTSWQDPTTIARALLASAPPSRSSVVRCPGRSRGSPGGGITGGVPRVGSVRLMASSAPRHTTR